MPDVGPEEGVPLSGWPDALVCLVEDHGVGAHLLQHAHRLNRVLPLGPHLCNIPRQVLRLQEKCQEKKGNNFKMFFYFEFLRCFHKSKTTVIKQFPKLNFIRRFHPFKTDYTVWV